MSITDPVQINEKKINNQIREYARNLFFYKYVNSLHNN